MRERVRCVCVCVLVCVCVCACNVRGCDSEGRVQVTAKAPLDGVERWEMTYGAGKGGREGGYAELDGGVGGMVPRSDLRVRHAGSYSGE